MRVWQPGGHLTVSAGVAIYPVDARTDEELVKAADICLYQAIEGGRNRDPGAQPGVFAGFGRPTPLLCTSRFSKKVWRMGVALVQSRQRKIERAP